MIKQNKRKISERDETEKKWNRKERRQNKSGMCKAETEQEKNKK